MKYTGAVFFDSDGTLTDDTANILEPTEKTLECFKRLLANGYLPVLCTGRGATYAGTAAKYFDSLITSNGAVATHGGRVIYENPVEPLLARRAVDYMDKNGVLYCLDNPKICYCSNLDDICVREWLKKFRLPISAFSDDPSCKSMKFYKISVMFNSFDFVEDMRREFDGELDVDLQAGVPFGDISPCGSGKSAGIKAVIERLNIPFENTYAFGDGENDVTMFKAVAHAAAMGVHASVLDDCAEFVTKTVSDEGVYFGLRHYGII